MTAATLLERPALQWTYTSFIEGVCVGLAFLPQLLSRMDTDIPLKLVVRSEPVVVCVTLGSEYDVMDVECFEFSHVRGTEVGEAWEDHGDGECGEFF